MSIFETVLLCILIPAGFIAVYVAGKYDLCDKLTKILETRTLELTERSREEKLRNYPCSDYLHNALRFISEGKSQVAYDEICHAIIRSGGCLTEEEEYNRHREDE